MPPSPIKTVRDQIYWQYAKIISDSAGFGKKNWGFVMSKFKKLQQGEIFWNEIREYIKEREKSGECIFCGRETELTTEHLFPQALNGPNTEKNIIWICQKCNSSKGKKRLYEAWTTTNGLKAAKYEIPRIAEGKYLKFVYEVLKENNLLGLNIDAIKKEFCPKCDLPYLCAKEKTVGKLSPLCLDGITALCLKKIK